MAIITGKTIKRMREEAGLSQIRLAELARISRAHVAKIETGRVDPRLSTVNRVLSVIEGSGRKTLCRDIMQREIVKGDGEVTVDRIWGCVYNMPTAASKNMVP